MVRLTSPILARPHSCQPGSHTPSPTYPVRLLQPENSPYLFIFPYFICWINSLCDLRIPHLLYPTTPSHAAHFFFFLFSLLCFFFLFLFCPLSKLNFQNQFFIFFRSLFLFLSFFIYLFSFSLSLSQQVQSFFLLFYFFSPKLIHFNEILVKF